MVGLVAQAQTNARKVKETVIQIQIVWVHCCVDKAMVLMTIVIPLLDFLQIVIAAMTLTKVGRYIKLRCVELFLKIMSLVLTLIRLKFERACQDWGGIGCPPYLT